MMGGGLPVSTGFGAKAVAAEQYVVNKKKELMRAMAVSPKYAQGEQELLEKQIDLDPKMMTNPTAWRIRTVAIARTIHETMDYNAKVIGNVKDGKTTQEQYEGAIQSQNLLKSFLETMDLPPRTKSSDDAVNLPSDTKWFIDEQWQLRKGPGHPDVRAKRGK